MVSWYEDLFQALSRSERFKFRWVERAHIKARYFIADRKGVISALRFIKKLLDRDIAALGIWFKLKRQPVAKPRSYGFYLRRCHAIENYPAILNYFLKRMSGSESDAEEPLQ